jgi:hypothetical protein
MPLAKSGIIDGTKVVILLIAESISPILVLH